ncbi:MAG: DUF2690 domain-containing protein [Umezawaea sp.]
MLLVTNITTGVIVYRVATPDPVGQARGATGDNPLMSQCLDDAEIAASSTKNPEFLLELVFSAKCQAGWARVTRRDDNAQANQIEVEIYRRSDPTGTSRQKPPRPTSKPRSRP